MTLTPELRELAAKKRRHVQESKDPDIGTNGALATAGEIYSDPAHFIDELLQNADDAGASETKIILHPDKLHFFHNGADFNIKNVKSILAYRLSTKTSNEIGKFGLGFKSVFAVSDNPQIYSGEFCFQIAERIIPEDIGNPDCGFMRSKKTVIVLPFNADGIKYYPRIAAKLRNIEAESMLFLKSIAKIEWQTDDDIGSHALSQDNEGAIRLVSASAQSTPPAKKYLLFSEACEADENNKVAAAFMVDGNKIVAADKTDVNKHLFVFFPVKKEKTELKFIVHAPYKTTPTRETVDFNDEDNQRITTQLARLVAGSIVKIKERGLFNAGFMADILPINTDTAQHGSIYGTVYEAVKKTLSEEAILPAADGSFVKKECALIVGSEELTDLIQGAEDMASLFDGKTHWLDSAIKEDSVLGKYLIKNFGIRPKDMRDFAGAVNKNKNFIAEKCDNWLRRLYSEIKTATMRHSWMDNYIIPLENGEYARPNDDGIYLPPADDMGYKSQFRVVKKSIAADESAHGFLVSLGIKELDNVAEIRECIAPKYQRPELKNREEYMCDFAQVHEIWRNAASAAQSTIISIVKNMYFILGVNHNGEEKLMKPDGVYPDAVYLKTRELAMWFFGDPKAFFVSPHMEKYPEFIGRLDIIKQINVNVGPWHFPESPYNYREWVGHDRCYRGANIPGLEHVLGATEINFRLCFRRSLFLWDLLMRSPTVRPEYRHRSRGCDWIQPYSKAESGILTALKGKHWLFDSRGKLLAKPMAEISLDDLHSKYARGDSAEKLAADLGMEGGKLRKLQNSASEIGYSVVPTQDVEEWARTKAEYEELKNKLAEQKKSKRRTSSGESEGSGRDNSSGESADKTPWNPPCPDPDDAEIGDFDTPAPISVRITEKNGGGQGGSGGGSESETTESDDDKSGHKKEIGKWGEKYAYRILRKRHADNVSWLNQDGESRESCDFVVKDKAGEVVAYYEIKSRSKAKPREFDVSDAEWKFAEKNGDKYYIWLISGAGTNTPGRMEFHNPVQMWRDKQVQAQPVRVKFKWRDDSQN